MADRRGLGILGFVLGSVAAAVMLIAVMMVKSHDLDGARMPVMAAAAPSVIR